MGASLRQVSDRLLDDFRRGPWSTVRVAFLDSVRMAAISSALSQHATESPFLWGLRSGGIAAPHYSLADLSTLDQRVEAHLDGLRVAGNEGWELCRKELHWKEASEIFAASV